MVRRQKDLLNCELLKGGLLLLLVLEKVPVDTHACQDRQNEEVKGREETFLLQRYLQGWTVRTHDSGVWCPQWSVIQLLQG